MKACLQMNQQFCSRENQLLQMLQQNEKSTQNYIHVFLLYLYYTVPYKSKAILFNYYYTHFKYCCNELCLIMMIMPDVLVWLLFILSARSWVCICYKCKCIYTYIVPSAITRWLALLHITEGVLVMYICNIAILATSSFF